MFASAFLALLALAHTATVRAVPPQVSYAGCMDSAPTGLEAVTTLGALGDVNAVPELCANYCRGLNYHYAFYLLDGPQTCGCRFVGPTATEWVGSADPLMTCGTGQWYADITWTTFSFPACYAGYLPSAPVGGPLPAENALVSEDTFVNDLGSCFRNCVGWGGAAIRPDGDVYRCTCDADAGLILPPDEERVPCNSGGSTIARYGGHAYNADGTGQDTGVQPPGQSVWVKRQLKDQMRLDQQAVAGKLCPGSATACLTSPGAMTWECVETDAELESCGGCLYGEFGSARRVQNQKAAQDCSTLAGVRMGGVTCEHGQCAVWACEDGFKLVDRACVPVA